MLYLIAFDTGTALNPYKRGENDARSALLQLSISVRMTVEETCKVSEMLDAWGCLPQHVTKLNYI